MATNIIFSRVLSGKSLVCVLNTCVLRRTLCGVTHKHCRQLIKSTNGTKWLTVKRYKASNVSVGGSDNKQQQQSASLGLADELLVSKLKSETSAKDNDDSSSGEKGDKDGGGGGDKDKERERTYRTLKYSFLAFGVMMSGMGTFLVYTWGELCH